MIRIFFCIIILVLYFIPQLYGCTSAIIGADKNPYGRPLLWKHRDTDNIDNKVEYVSPSDGSYGYVALFNAQDKNLDEAWTGMNEKGFAIMNTASYNIKNDNIPENEMDKEGFIMTKALQTCVTVDDFEKLLTELPKPLGVEANFGVIDAYGNGAYFETNNYSFNRINLKDSPDNVLIRTNYSHTGRKNEGFGYVREKNAEHLLTPYIKNNKVTAELLTEEISRSYYHSLFDKDFIKEGDKIAVDQDFIPRYKTTATIVIEGCKPLKENEKPTKEFIEKEYIMWTGLGYPPCAEIIPVWCKPEGVDTSLRGLGNNGHSQMSDKVKARRDEVFPIHFDNGNRYIDFSKLSNDEGTGYLQVLVPQNREVYKKISEKREDNNK